MTEIKALTRAHISIENKHGVHRINAKSVNGVMYMGGNVSCHDETFTIAPQTATFLKVQHNQ